MGRSIHTPWLAAAILAGLAAVVAGPAAAEDDFAARRTAMVKVIAKEAWLTQRWTGRQRFDRRVMAVMGRVPRHAFVPPPLARFAYSNRPLPVGHGQTVSQPYIVALMTELADIDRRDEVLLIGIGGGYHAAILSTLAGRVRCVEMQPEVAEAALARLKGQGYDGIDLRLADPYYGWRGARAAFDAIVVRQAMDYIPKTLLNQLKPGGRLVLPAGPSDAGQQLTVAIRRPDGRVIERHVMPVRFTRMPGGSRI